MPSTRRRFLASVGAAGALFAAGCSGGPVSGGTAANGDETNWPTAGLDATNTRYVEDGSAPRSGASTRWRVEIGFGLGAEPAVVDGVVYAPVVDDLLALDAESGDRLWSIDPPERGAQFWSTPTVADGTVYVHDSDGLRALDAETGEEQWSRSLDPRAGTVSPTMDHDGDELFVGRGERVYQFAAETGETRWSRRLFGRFSTTFAYNARWLVAVAEGGDVYALDPESGDGFWRRRLPDHVQCPPTMDDGTTYVGCFDGHVYALGDRGQVLWNTEVGGFAKGGIAATDDAVFADGGRELHAIDARSGEHRWSVPVGSARDHPPVVVDDVVYTGGDRLRAVKPGGGIGLAGHRFDATRFSADLGGVVGAIVAADGSLFAAVRGEDAGALVRLDPL